MQLTNQYQWYRLGESKLGTDEYGGSMYIRIYARWISQNESTLTSLVEYQARGYYSGGGWIIDQGSNGSVSGTGAVSGTFTKSTRYSSGETPLLTLNGTVTHDQDTGEASLTASATLSFPNWSDWGSPTKTASGTADLPTIEVSTLRLGVNNQWKKATPYLRVNGSWKKCKAYLRVNGSWKKGA